MIAPSPLKLLIHHSLPSLEAISRKWQAMKHHRPAQDQVHRWCLETHDTKKMKWRRPGNDDDYQKACGLISDGKMINESILKKKEAQRQYNLHENSTFPRVAKMGLLLLPPGFPTLVRGNTDPTTVVNPLIPICPIINDLLPFKSRGIEKEGCKEPRSHHEPHWQGYQNISNYTSVRLPKHMIHNEEDHKFDSLDKVGAWV